MRGAARDARSTKAGITNVEVTGPPEAPVVDLQEDEAAREAVRGDLRPPRDPRARQHGARTATTRSASSTTAGRRCRSASRTTSRSRSRTATSRCTRRCSGRAASCTRSRSARARCTARRTSASRRTGATRKTRRADELDRHLAWFRQVLELQIDAKTPDEFLEFLKLDLYQDEIFVFTPTGDVIQLPKGATPIDFAFAVHTEVGLPLRRARRSTAASRRCRGRSGTRRRSRSSRRRRRSRRATGSRTSAPAARATRSGRCCDARSSTSAEKLGQEILEREVKRRRLAQARRRRSSTRPRRRSASPTPRTCSRRSGRAT